MLILNSNLIIIIYFGRFSILSHFFQKNTKMRVTFPFLLSLQVSRDKKSFKNMSNNKNKKAMKKSTIIMAVFTLFCISANAQWALSQCRVINTVKTNQTVRYLDGGRFYGTLSNGVRCSGRLVQPDGIEVLGGFDGNGRMNGVCEVTYPREQAWYKGEHTHGVRNGSGSFYKDGRYYDQQWET